LYLGSNTVNSEAGLYVDLLINGTPAKFLIDTGATISLLADSLFEKSKSSCKPRIQQVTQDIVAANGQPLFLTSTVHPFVIRKSRPKMPSTERFAIIPSMGV
jgi:hypothetical protein